MAFRRLQGQGAGHCGCSAEICLGPGVFSGSFRKHWAFFLRGFGIASYQLAFYQVSAPLEKAAELRDEVCQLLA